ncbi:hypothetical protein AABM38_10395 [Heyndrickxia sp. MSNUG]|uniref:hypothetical protein n=1 Tax=Heyndrickxia sp. MSNUG TaxID=3136677 RepID=UPI003C2F6DCA
MKKVILWSIITAIIIGLVVWVVSKIIPFSYAEWSFFIGLGLSVILFFFSSSGGLSSKGATFEASQAGWKIQKDDELKVNVGGVFYGAVLYTIVSLVIMIVIYF